MKKKEISALPSPGESPGLFKGGWVHLGSRFKMHDGNLVSGSCRIHAPSWPSHSLPGTSGCAHDAAVEGPGSKR